MFPGEDVVVATITSRPRSLKYMKAFRHMNLVDSRLDFGSKKDFMNNRCHSVETLFSLLF